MTSVDLWDEAQLGRFKLDVNGSAHGHGEPNTSPTLPQSPESPKTRITFKTTTDDGGSQRPTDNGYVHAPSRTEHLLPESATATSTHQLSPSNRQRWQSVTSISRATRRLSQNRLIRPKACHVCTSLKLTFDSFVIEDDIHSGKVTTSYFYGKKRVGTYEAIIQRSRECELCKLLAKSLSDRPTAADPPEAPDLDALCSLFWRVDGREYISSASDRAPSTVKRTRRLAIEWQSGGPKLDLSYIVLVAPDGQFRPDGTVNSENTGRSRSSFFLGRKLTSLDVSNTQLVAKWLQLCQENHTACTVDHNNARYQDLLQEPSFTILDLEQMCLSELPESAKYVALSYTWGQVKEDNIGEQTYTPSGNPASSGDMAAADPNAATQKYVYDSNTGEETEDTENTEQRDESRAPNGRFKTTRENVDRLSAVDGVRDKLKNMPLAIQNAVALAKHLGFRYIWIDSLCIIQDSQDSWKINARMMDVVYGNAELTICAADGDGADEGLQALYNSDTGEPNHPTIRPATDQQVIVGYPTHGSDEGTLELMLSWPSESYTKCSLWNRRAWTFQERMISPRCLICVNKRVYFQCHTTTMSEDVYSDEKTAKGSAGWSVELYGAPAHTLKRLQYDPIGVYKECLRMYTTRKLSVEEDILTAFTGIGNIICQHLGRPKSNNEDDRALLFGLPVSHFDFALLWQPREAPERRKLGDLVLPTWSWSGWKCEEGMDYRRAAVAGPEINLHEWLLRHTWITYYIRNDDGHLRLVWDPKRFKHSDASEGGRWKGYDAPDGGWPCDTGTLDIQVDFHGRPFDKTLPRQGSMHEHAEGPNMPQFKECLYPFKWRNRMLRPGSKKRANAPDKPYLQFWTWWGRFHISVESDEDSFIQIPAQAGNGLKRYAILDRHRDFAGVVLLDEGWTKEYNEDEPHEFIALSDAREFDASECGDWNLYTEEDQHVVPWQLYNVLMIVRDDPNKAKERQGDNVAYRRGLGKIYKQAFEHACVDKDDKKRLMPEWKEIILG